MKVVTIIQARTTSQRLPNKVLMDVYGKSLLDRVIDQCLKISLSNALWVATSQRDDDNGIELICLRRGIKCFRGSLEDVRSRFHSIAIQENADVIVRVTADNPLTEPSYADQMITYLSEHPCCEYVRMQSDVIPYGSGSEVFRFPSFVQAIEKYDNQENKEHVTPALIQHSCVANLVPENKDLVVTNPFNVTVDTMRQYEQTVKMFQDNGEAQTLLNEIGKYKNR